jgi:hypothetical protein
MVSLEIDTVVETKRNGAVTESSSCVAIFTQTIPQLAIDAIGISQGSLDPSTSA